MVVLIDAKPKFLDRTGVRDSEGGVDVGAACVSFRDDTFGDWSAMGGRSLRCFELLESPEEEGLLFFAEEAEQGLQSFAIIIIVPHLALILSLILKQHKFLKEQCRSLENQSCDQFGQDQSVLLAVHSSNYK